MVETLSNLLRSVAALSPADLLPVLYLSLNRLGPPQQGLELGIGDGILLKAVAQATGEEGAVVEAPAVVGGASREGVERPGAPGRRWRGTGKVERRGERGQRAGCGRRAGPGLRRDPVGVGGGAAGPEQDGGRD